MSGDDVDISLTGSHNKYPATSSRKRKHNLKFIVIDGNTVGRKSEVKISGTQLILNNKLSWNNYEKEIVNKARLSETVQWKIGDAT